MNLLTTIAFAVLLLSLQYDEAQSVSPTFSRSPWANPIQASSLMNCLMTKIASSNVLPQQEKEDLESIADTLMSAITGASAKGKTSGAQLQAINMAVASSLAELVVAEDEGNPASIAVKTRALSGALENCFQTVMGTVDKKFLREINKLISMFAKEAAIETNEIIDQGDFYSQGISASSSFQASSQGIQESSQTNSVSQTTIFNSAADSQDSSLISDAYTNTAKLGIGPQVSQPRLFGQTPGANAGLISRLAKALERSDTMRTVFDRNISKQTLSTLVQRAVQTLSINFGIDSNNLSRIVLQTISRLPSGSDTSAYSQAFSTALIKAGVLDANNFNTMESEVVLAFLNGISSAAESLRESVDRDIVQNGLSSSSSSLSSSTSSSSFSQTSNAASASGISDAYTNTAKLSIGPQVSQPRLSGQTTGSNAGLISTMAKALANSSTFRRFLHANVSKQAVSTLMQGAIQKLSTDLGIEGNELSRITLQAFSQLPSNSDTFAYSKALSTIMCNAGVLNDSNFNSVGPQVLSGILNGFLNVAKNMGMNVDARSVQSDIRSSSRSLSSSTSSSSFSQTAGTSSVNSVNGGFGSVDGLAQFGSSSGQTSLFTSSADSQSDFSQSTAFISSGAGQSSSVSVSSLLNSPIGLRSGSAVSRISQLTSSIGNAISRNRVDANALARILQENFSTLQSSGMAASDAKIETLLEVIVGLVQLLSNTEIRGVNVSTAPFVANSAVRSFEYVFA